MISRKSYESFTGLNQIRRLIYLLTETQVMMSQNDPDHTDIFQQEEECFKYSDDVLILPLQKKFGMLEIMETKKDGKLPF